MKPKNYTPHGVNMVRFGEKRPLLEVELNELQQNFIQMNAESIRQSTFTGFLQMNNFGGHVDKKPENNINRFFLTDFVEKVDIVNLDGYTMPLRSSDGSGNIEIKLPEPPEEGIENNLVFLEFWYADVSHEKPIYRYGCIDNEVEDVFKIDPRIGIETTRRTQLRWRIRTIRDVDFEIFPKGMTDPRVTALAEAELGYSYYRFKPMEHDPFIFQAGETTEKAKEDLRTIDGFVYAVPLFRVKRRNSGGFTEVNPNGAILYDGGLSDRPDGLFADVIDERDIIDLRNKVSLNGFNYEKLLHQEFDKFLRTENGKLELSKTYHGIPKTPSENKVFQATFDGSAVAEIGGQTNVNNDRFVPTPTGLGINLEGADPTPFPVEGINKAEGEITFLVNFDTVSKFDQTGYIAILDEEHYPVFQVLNNGRYIVCEAEGNGKIEYKQHLLGYHYVTFAWKDPQYGSMGTMELYIDGNRVQNRGYRMGEKEPTCVVLGYGSILGHLQYNNSVIVSDVSISNKYGCQFENMPEDFKLGFANLAPKFNRQRRIFGEGQVSQTTVAKVKALGTEHSEGTNKVQATDGTWSVGDKITVKGIGGEIISGIVDERAVRVRITHSTEDEEYPSAIINVASTADFQVGEKVRIWRMETNQVSKEFTVMDVNSQELTVTLNENVIVVGGSYFIDSTFTDSTPTVRTVKSVSDSAEVIGNWTGLGSPNAEFTITEIPEGYETEDIVVVYSLNTPSKQRGLPEVLNEVHEANLGEQILVPQRTFSIIDDFKGKVVDSDIENPNRSLYLEAPTLGNVEDFIPSNQFVYDSLGEKDGVTVTAEASTKDNIPQRLFEFDLVKIIEQKFGKEIPDVNKLEWIKRNVESIEFKWWGYGASPSGNKATLAIQDNELRTWVSYVNHEENTVKELSLMVSGLSYDKMIDLQGKIRFIAYSEPAVSAEQISTIFTDYASLELILRKRDNYDFLVPVKEQTRLISLIDPTPPENNDDVAGVDGGIESWRFKEFIPKDVNRRDYPVSNLLLIQKQTKTVETMFEANPDELFVTYGSYVPVADNVQTVEEVTILAESDGFLLTDVSSESAHVLGNHHWSNPLYRVRNDNRSLVGDIGFDVVPFTADSRKVNIGAHVVINGVGPLNYFTRQYATLDEPKQVVGIARFLVMHNHELKLWIASLHPNGKVLDLDKSEVSILVPLQGNPVVKEEEGIKRTNILPTTWRTESGEVRGYFDEFGNFVATYQ